MNENEKNKSIVNKATVNISWGIPWLAGFLFTLGADAFPTPVEALNFWGEIALVFVDFITWPFYLGIKVFGG